MPLSPGRISPRNMDDRQWAQFVAQAGIQADRNVKTFAPTWIGFGTDPVGELSYYDFGALVMLWDDAGLSATSDSTDLSFTGLPSAITPDNDKSGLCVLFDNGSETIGRAVIQNDGTVFFQKSTVTGAVIGFNTLGFTAANIKGLAPGWFLFYSKR